MLRALDVPSGTPFPIFLWNLTIIGGKEGNAGVIADLQVNVDKSGKPVHDLEVALYLVTSFQPEDLRDILIEAKRRGDDFARVVLDAYLNRLAFPSKQGESSEISFAMYNLCRSREEQEEAKKSVDPAGIELLLLGVREGLLMLTGYDLYRSGSGTTQSSS
jgi:hypothetical protein